MMVKKEGIWGDDLLGRRLESEMLQNFLVQESAFFASRDRPSSFILAIDAPYGRGKSHFLERFQKQLSTRHPVAVIDAWADDANDEPLTAFMAAIDEALQPYLSKSSKLKAKIGKAKRAAFPVLGKIIVGAATKTAQKLAGDQIAEQVGEAVDSANEDDPSEYNLAFVSGVEEAVGATGNEIEALVDRQGAAMLEAYKRRKKSRAEFRKNMDEVISQFSVSNFEKDVPFFVVIDELDRCRPDYAIKVLEEIKHFFEVKGIVFVIAVHLEQLSSSVKAIYGDGFDSKSYLNRFFSRVYRLQELNLEQIVESELDGFEGVALLNIPNIYRVGPISSLEFVARMFDDWKVTPREAISLTDAFRVFASNWDKPCKIEPIPLFCLLLRAIRQEPLTLNPIEDRKELLVECLQPVSVSGFNPVGQTLNQIVQGFSALAGDRLSKFVHSSPNTAVHHYVTSVLGEERRQRLNEEGFDDASVSVVNGYASRIDQIAPFIVKAP